MDDLPAEKLQPAPPKRKRTLYHERNLEAARIILADPAKYEGTVSWVWAERVMEKEN
jgi:hypothetical protein